MAGGPSDGWVSYRWHHNHRFLDACPLGPSVESSVLSSPSSSHATGLRALLPFRYSPERRFSGFFLFLGSFFLGRDVFCLNGSQPERRVPPLTSNFWRSP